MEFKIDSDLPATSAQLWDIFFDVQRIASLIPGCEDVKEITPLEEYSAVLKQKIGPFKFEVPARITVAEQVPQQLVRLRAMGRDRITRTTLDVGLDVQLGVSQTAGHCHLVLAADMQLNGKLASLGFGTIKKKSDELFVEFERRLGTLLDGLNTTPGQALVDPITRARAPAE